MERTVSGRTEQIPVAFYKGAIADAIAVLNANDDQIVDTVHDEIDETDRLWADAVLAGKEKADLISTCVYNEATCTSTCRFLCLDLIETGADESFKTNGRLDWLKIAARLSDSNPRILNRISDVARYPCGRGLCLFFQISPLELARRSASGVESFAAVVGFRLRKVFAYYRMGASESTAAELDRYAPNLFNEDLLIESQRYVTGSEAESRRDRVLSDLYSATLHHPAFDYVRKSDLAEQGELFHPDARVEKKLVPLYKALSAEGERAMRFADIKAATRLAEDTLRKILKNPPAWLKVERLKQGCYSLSATSSMALDSRLQRLKKTSKPFFSLPPPEEVKDGNRYEWLGWLLAHLKQHGITREAAQALLPSIVKRVPDWAYSRTMTHNLTSSIASIYGNRIGTDDNTFAIRRNAEMVPWVALAIKEPRSVEPSTPETSSPKTLNKKGIPTESPLTPNSLLPLVLSPGPAGLTLEAVLAPSNLSAALADVAGRRGRGPDGIRPAFFPSVWADEAEVVLEKIRAGSYVPGGLRKSPRSKPGGGFRTISIGNARDRMLEAALTKVLKPHFERVFSPYSFAYRKGFGTKKARAAARTQVLSGRPWVLTLDIQNYFDTVDHMRLLDLLAFEISDEALLSFIRGMLKSWSALGLGIPQGSSVSNLLSNIYLDRLDKWLVANGVAHCRYSDDIRIFGRTRLELENALKKTAVFLEEALGLHLNDRKTEIDRAENVYFCKQPILDLSDLVQPMLPPQTLSSAAFASTTIDAALLLECLGPRLPDPDSGILVSSRILVMECGTVRYAELLLGDIKTETWLSFNRRAFQALGGVPRLIRIPDKKLGYLGAYARDPLFVRSYSEFSIAYGFDLEMAGGDIAGRHSLIRAALKASGHDLLAANTLVSSLNSEPCDELLHSLLPLPMIPPQTGVWSRAILDSDSHFHAAGVRYSAPYQLIGTELLVRTTARTVEAYAGNYQVASHGRSFKKSQITDPSHMPADSLAIRMRAPAYFLRLATAIGPNCRRWVLTNFRSGGVLQQLKSVQGVVSLQRRYGAERLEAACREALSAGQDSPRAVRKKLLRSLSASIMSI